MLIPQRLGPFEVRRFLGGGGVGEVHLAYDQEQRKEVALKLVRLNGVDHEMLEAEKNGTRLQQELGKVVPHVPRIFRHGEIDSFFYVSMEYVEGEDLARVISRGRLPEAHALDIALQLCDLLVKFHEFPFESAGRLTLGIVHGDIKPENIVLQAGDRIRIIDFGIAKQLALGRSFTRNQFGSPPYMPPERLQHGAVDFQSDLWATVVVLYQMVAGHLPFSGSSPEAIEQEIRQGNPPALPKGCSDNLRWVLSKGLLPVPESRFPDARALKERLEKVRSSLPAASPPVVETVRTRPTMSPPPSDPTPQAVIPTEPPPPGEPPKLLISPSPNPSPAPIPRKHRLSAPRVAVAAILLLGLGLLGSQAWVWQQAREIRRALTAEDGKPTRAGDLDTLLERYRRAEGWCLVDSILKDAAERLADALSASAEETFAMFRRGGQTIERDQWEQALRHLEAALTFRPQDSGLEVRRIYTLGHLAHAKANEQTPGSTERRSLLKDAAAAFGEAARLEPVWFDPCLALCRIYAYEKEMRGSEGLLEAETMARKRGAGSDPRLVAMLADGHLHHGRRMAARARRARDTQEERELLEETYGSLVKAVRFYGEIHQTPIVIASKAEALKLLGPVERRIEERRNDHLQRAFGNITAGSDPAP